MIHVKRSIEGFKTKDKIELTLTILSVYDGETTCAGNCIPLANPQVLYKGKLLPTPTDKPVVCVETIHNISENRVTVLHSILYDKFQAEKAAKQLLFLITN
jgi:hypothetical protein